MHTSNTDHDETLKEQIEQALQKDFNNLLVKEFTTDWKIQRLKIGLDIEVMDFDNLMQLIKEDREKFTERAVELINKNLFSAEDERENIRETLTQLSNPAHEAQRQDFNTEG